ncbi:MULTISPECIES: hypothetical protein [Saccharothrix]|uniref:hypothetical protein n=1 Tax=Saccharothrix TaxID=2071 RepID=UPI00093C4F09|nr:hypothetical protein [Saccharothrix sp. CB00851]OKI18695.1 hypothetical protein A6A25_39345 [Saccharothrix sp. CB00851]
MVRIALGLVGLLVAVMLTAVFREPSVVVGQASPQWDRVSPITMRETFEDCAEGARSLSTGPLVAGPVLARSDGFVVVGSSLNYVLACVRNGALPSSHGLMTGSASTREHVLCPCGFLVLGDPEGTARVGYGRVRSDVVAVHLRTRAGLAIQAQVSGGVFLADLAGVTSDEWTTLSYRALDATGTVLAEW